MLIKDVMGDRLGTVVSITPDTPLPLAAKTLKTENVGVLAVVDGSGGLIGIISERDLIHQMDENGAVDANCPVALVMTTNIIDCDPESPVDSVLSLMRMMHVRHIPVNVEGELVGMVSLRDLAFCHMEDIGEERKKALHSEHGYWDFIVISPDAAFVEIEGFVEFANEPAAKLFGAGKISNFVGTETAYLFDRPIEEIMAERGRCGLGEGEWSAPAALECHRLDETSFSGQWTTTTILWGDEVAVLHVVRDGSAPGASEISPPQTDLKVREAT